MSSRDLGVWSPDSPWPPDASLRLDESKSFRWYVRAWARQGIFPPPFQGAPDSPGSVALMQGAREPELPPIELMLSDEESIARQEARARAVYVEAVARFPPGDPAVRIGPQ
jgi:hypothetical protein